ncbi:MULTISPECIES: Tim44/TimA family putative adaptor protein [Rhizobium/Agrobacterium group]|uniref:Membrane associated transporter protein n=2 Tax=Rhizobium/Agrobacterium group TaxID=227290 RepID=B9JXU6_ALLAM|nr:MULTISPECIES: Tim44/TimA family putative adaptor protein [Rhizobium/Agrobacterium group]ACM34976.1 Membrane associated transporter protein [Allorhizobium ampelinum S4]MCF1491893.1 Tim44 domain-containing protein [Allorhizobium ampelinum]MUO28732.1 Tim44/TimA family putative adaptor protein [Agrobacterium vitis]MUO42688.1 Tim44/TimA family putative adaptor protein [Agrobacterium vitis]MUP09702.1 Tim44/TimA family putative adaptor protein [Agrobacterium vitis]
MGSNDFVTLFFLVAAVLIFWQLRSVLGRRTGNEKPPKDPFAGRPDAASPAAEDARVVTLPRRDEADGEERQTAIDAYAPAGTPLNQQLRQVVEVDPSFVPKEFLNGARMAYEMIVTAFAAGDRKSLKDLLSREVYDGFDAAITEREQRGEVMKSTFVGIDKAEITSAEVRDQEVQITVRLVSQLISATYDSQGAVIEGDAESVGDVNDIWTFARDTRSRDPNWKLIATESDQ